MERAGFFMSLIDDAYRARGRWAKVRYIAVVDAVYLSLNNAIATIDPLARVLAKK
jgi:hypothetical protein